MSNLRERSNSQYVYSKRCVTVLSQRTVIRLVMLDIFLLITYVIWTLVDCCLICIHTISSFCFLFFYQQRCLLFEIHIKIIEKYTTSNIFYNIKYWLLFDILQINAIQNTNSRNCAVAILAATEIFIIYGCGTPRKWIIRRNDCNENNQLMEVFERSLGKEFEVWIRFEKPASNLRQP